MSVFIKTFCFVEKEISTICIFFEFNEMSAPKGDTERMLFRHGIYVWIEWGKKGINSCWTHVFIIIYYLNNAMCDNNYVEATTKLY